MTATRRKIFSCELLNLLISIKTVLALIGIILGSFSITLFQQRDISMTSQKQPSFRQKSSIAVEESQLTEIIKLSMK